MPNAQHTSNYMNKTDASSIPLEEIDVSKPALYRQDTWRPLFQRLRHEAPVHYQAESDVGPFWSVSSYEMVMAVDTNHSVFSSEEGGIGIIDPKPIDEERLTPTFIQMDEPKHGEQRKTVSPAVSPQNLKELEPLIRERASNILDNLPVNETFDWVDKVSIELTASMLATLFDFPQDKRRDLIRWSDLATAQPGISENFDVQARKEGLLECASVFYELWQKRSVQEPKPDLISMLAHGEATKDLAEHPLRMLGNILLLIVGGNDTTRNSISGGVLALNQFPDEYLKLTNNWNLIPNMVSEMIRWQSPVIHMRRTALKDVELDGKHIRKGDKVVMWYLSGNRDETIFPDADRLIIDRPNARRHLAFGFGIHRCMGNRLAEMQLRVLWEEIMKRFKHVEVVGETERISSNFIRGIGKLPVRVHPY
ncbi:MAG: cytochrome P450 [Parvibaculaceae bacterium]